MMILQTSMLQAMPIRVLLIDDDAMSRELLAALLARKGYAVQVAESGATALEVLQQGAFAPDLMLTDLQMPGISGSQLADLLRCAGPPTALLLAMSGSRPLAHEISHYDGFLLKPFKLAEIADALQAHHSANAIHSASDNGISSPLQAEQSAPFVPRESTAIHPVLDEIIYKKLSDTLSTQQLDELYAMCLSDVRRRIEAMRGFAAALEAKSFAREAHSIKGSCGMLGATELHKLAAHMEEFSLEPSGTSTAQAVNSLDDLAAACARLERVLGALA
jgi:CheY-like chemotaxis protein/HPt (histidine-containing phosphotransfer) domain-containing protein